MSNKEKCKCGDRIVYSVRDKGYVCVSCRTPMKNNTNPTFSDEQIRIVNVEIHCREERRGRCKKTCPNYKQCSTGNSPEYKVPIPVFKQILAAMHLANKQSVRNKWLENRVNELEIVNKELNEELGK